MRGMVGECLCEVMDYEGRINQVWKDKEIKKVREKGESKKMRKKKNILITKIKPYRVKIKEEKMVKAEVDKEGKKGGKEGKAIKTIILRSKIR